MFPLHDRTRRTLCRWIFLLVGLLPTAGVAAWSASINGSGHREAICGRLEAALGLNVRVPRVSYPRPGSMLWEGVELTDPETGEVIVRMRLLEMSGDERGDVLVASQPEVELAHIERLRSIVDAQLRRRGGASQRALRIAAGELTLRWPGGVRTLVECNAQLDGEPAKSSIVGSFRMVDGQESDGVRVSARRESRGGQPATSIEFDSSGAPLPCSLLAAVLGCENRFGAHSTFGGKVVAGEAPDGWRAEIRGQIEHIDLDALVSDRFAHRLGGAAKLTIDRATLRGGRLEEADVVLHAGPGVVSESLVAAASKWLGMQRGTQQHSGAVDEYSELAAEFVVDDEGFSIRGQCDEGEPGVVLRSGEIAILREPSGPVPVVALVNALAPDSQIQVSATRQSDWLLSVLPVPEASPRDSQAAPQARLRMRSAK